MSDNPVVKLFKRLLNGTPLPLVDPMRFLVDEEVRPFWRDARQDVTAQGTLAPKQLSTGVFVVNEFKVLPNTVDVVLGIAPHLWARTDPETPGESLVSLPDQALQMGAGQGWWLFNWLKAGQQPYIMQTDYNTPRLQANANNKDRFSTTGISWLPPSVLAYMQFGYSNALTPIACQPDTLFQVTWQLAPVAAAAVATPNPYVIGSGVNRIDCVGAMVFGLSMPKALYDEFVVSRRAGLLGNEAG